MCIDWRLVLAACLVPGIASAASWPEPPVPPQTSTTDVARHIVFNGLDMRARTFRSERNGKEILAFYKNAWGKDMVVNRLGESQVIGHGEGDYFITVNVTPAGRGSKGTIGIVDVSSAPEHFEPGKGLPHPMGSKVFNDIAYPDDPVPARTVAMRNGLSPRQNADFFRERLAGDGWKPAGQGKCSDASCVMSYTRGDQKMSLVMTRAEGDQSQVIINLQQPQGVR
jgi:hypothetical protein